VVSVKIMQFGRAPASVIDGIGNPVAGTVKLPPVPTVKVAELGLPMTGGVCAVD
jgi:hypothetical protein